MLSSHWWVTRVSTILIAWRWASAHATGSARLGCGSLPHGFIASFSSIARFHCLLMVTPTHRSQGQRTLRCPWPQPQLATLLCSCELGPASTAGPCLVACYCLAGAGAAPGIVTSMKPCWLSQRSAERARRFGHLALANAWIMLPTVIVPSLDSFLASSYRPHLP